jgi:predicted HD phosphohydrolase
MTEVSFSQMKDGTQADYEFLERLEDDHIRGLPDRIMNALAGLSDGLAGYKIDRLQHSLQTATRAGG